MDETPTPPPGSSSADPGSADAGSAQGPIDPAVPAAAQETLPFDAALDEPIPYRLTARARRAVAPDSLPDLTLLSEDATATDDQPTLDEAVPSELDDPRDTRAARARALRHAGIDVDQIAEELRVDPLVVRAWVADIVPVHSARRRLRAVPGGPAPAREHEARHEARRRRSEEAFDATRSAARHAARDRIAADPAFVAGLGVLSGVAEIGPQGIVVTTRDGAVARAVLRWLAATVELDPARLRVLLRLAPQVAADRAVHDWQRATGVAAERVKHTRWRDAPSADAVEAMIRIADPRVAGAVAGWRDALLGSFEDGGDGVDLAW